MVLTLGVVLVKLIGVTTGYQYRHCLRRHDSSDRAALALIEADSRNCRLFYVPNTLQERRGDDHVVTTNTQIPSTVHFGHHQHDVFPLCRRGQSVSLVTGGGPTCFGSVFGSTRSVRQRIDVLSVERSAFVSVHRVSDGIGESLRSVSWHSVVLLGIHCKEIVL